MPAPLTVLCVGLQVVTILVTWPLWQARSDPPYPNLPWFDGCPSFSCGWLILATLAVVLARPGLGWMLHVAVLVPAIAMDQIREQPQVIGIAVLMGATIDERLARVARWYLVSLWFWSGLHKVLSPDWMGPATWKQLEDCGLDPAPWHTAFAVGVATYETCARRAGGDPSPRRRSAGRVVASRDRGRAQSRVAGLEPQRHPLESLHGDRRGVGAVEGAGGVSSNLAGTRRGAGLFDRARVHVCRMEHIGLEQRALLR
ncbi:MAG: hypothetical protein QM811_25835 [Pirellulales bacterium]